LLSLICVDLVFEWLWDVRHRLTRTEYVVCLATFGSIQAVGVEYGILAGVALYGLCRKLGFNVGRDAKLGAWSSAPPSTEPSPTLMDGAAKEASVPSRVAHAERATEDFEHKVLDEGPSSYGSVH
jgi:hypothetical protein